MADAEVAHVCGFCSRRVFADDTVNLGCAYCHRKTRTEIERELRPWAPYQSDIDLLDFYGGIGPVGDDNG